MRASLLSVLALSGCIDRIDLGFEVHPDARTILLRTTSGRLHALPADAPELVTAEEPEEAVILSQSIEELQLEGVVEDDPSGPRALPPYLAADDPPPCVLPWSMRRDRMHGGYARRGVVQHSLRSCPADSTEGTGRLLHRLRSDARADLRLCAGRGPLRRRCALCSAGRLRRADPRRCGVRGAGSDRRRWIPRSPFGTIAAAIANGAIRIALLAGTHASPGTVRDVDLFGECASTTAIDGDLTLVGGALERVEVRGLLRAAGTSSVTGVAASGIVVVNGVVQLSSIASRRDDGVGLAVRAGLTTAHRIDVRAQIGITCASSTIALSDVVAELASDGGIGFRLDPFCT